MKYKSYNFNDCYFMQKWILTYSLHLISKKDDKEFGRDMMYRINGLTSNIADVVKELHFTVELITNQTEDGLKQLGVSFDLSEFHQYQYDNFILRIVSLLDISAKTGNLICQLGIDHEKCNWRKFTDHKRIKGTDLESKLIEIKRHIGWLRLQRNLKLHKGIAGDNLFGGIVYWSMIFELLDEKPSDEEILLESERVKLEGIAHEMHQFVYKLSKLISSYLNELEPFIENAAVAYARRP